MLPRGHWQRHISRLQHRDTPLLRRRLAQADLPAQPVYDQRRLLVPRAATGTA